jgi:antitoxin (DNA-binding transcriptional repressor) of toxin-antitoxin stability system
MKTVPVMELRRHLGAVLDDVRLKSETIIIERAGKPIVMLCPVDRVEYPVDKIARKIRAVQELAGIYTESPRGKNVQKWIDDERNDWE